MPEDIRLPVAEYMPDLGDYPNAGSAVVKNVYPRTPISYGPVPTPVPRYATLGTRCLGAVAARDNDGNTIVFSGDTTNLYRVAAGLSNWENVSKTAGAYAAAEWRFTYFNGDVLATDQNDAIQAFTLGSSSTFSDLAGAAPKAKYIDVIKNTFVMVGDTVDSDGAHRQRIQWCAAGNHRDWPILGSNDAAQKQSGAVDLLGPGGFIMGFATGLINADAVIFQEYAVRRMTYTGPPTTFSVLPVENAVGCVASNSIVVRGGWAYYWAQDGIYAFDGTESKAIGANKIDKTVFGDVDQANLSRVSGTIDPRNKLIIWAYPTSQATGGNPDRLLFYNWQLDKWSIAEVTCETLLRLLTIGYTLDELETVLGYALVDLIPYPLSSSVWLGGVPQLAAFDTDHQLSFFVGTPLEATVDTAEMQFTAGMRQMIRSARPLVDGTGVTPSVAIGYRELSQGAVTWGDAVNMNAMGACPQRRSGRYVRARITVPASALWNNISGVELDAAPQGSR